MGTVVFTAQQAVEVLGLDGVFQEHQAHRLDGLGVFEHLRGAEHAVGVVDEVHVLAGRLAHRLDDRDGLAEVPRAPTGLEPSRNASPLRTAVKPSAQALATFSPTALAVRACTCVYRRMRSRAAPPSSL